MAEALPGLPNEIVLEIWSHVLEPKDVESFALASKSIYALAIRFIEEHQRLKNQFSVWYHPDVSPAATFLALILLNPRVALYVDEVRIHDWKFGWDDPATQALNRPNECHLPYSEDTMQLFEGAVKTSAFIAESEIAEWILEIANGDEDNIVALIISLLPKLKRLELENVTDQRIRLSQMIRQIGRSPAATALSRLKYVELGRDDTDSVTSDLDWVTDFSFLKSVKSIKGWGVGQLDGDPNHWLSIPPKWSNVTVLHLHRCNVDHKRLSIYLQCVGALQEFSYTAADEGSPFDAFWLRTALAQATHSLKRLEILSSDGTGSHMGSLAGFNVLTELTTEYRMLLGYEAEFAGEKLIQMLPPSIERVTLERNDRYHVRRLQDPISGMCKLKVERLPNLMVLTYRINHSNLREPKLKQTTEEYAEDSEIISMLKQRSLEVRVKLHISQILPPQILKIRFGNHVNRGPSLRS